MDAMLKHRAQAPTTGLGGTSADDLLRLKGKDGQSPEAIKEVAKQFESIFLHQVFKSMRATVPKDGLLSGGFGGEVFTDMLDQKYADVASSSSSFGLADSIARQLGGGTDESMFQLEQRRGLRRIGGREAYTEKASKPAWSKPVVGELMTEFGPSRALRATNSAFNRGVEFQAKTGAAIKAAESGTVATVESLDNGVTRLTLAHEGGVRSTYQGPFEAHAVIGKRIEKGSVIGRLSEADDVENRNLYFAVEQNGRAIDPSSLFKK
ncbi:MAG: rod-binding protein [Bradymonadia bacterium]